jgi:hypothetical protein
MVSYQLIWSYAGPVRKSGKSSVSATWVKTVCASAYRPASEAAAQNREEVEGLRCQDLPGAFDFGPGNRHAHSGCPLGA